ncbi:MAG: efflux RND transporter periplasmic adaptor subunit [Verrucomicrobiota bacterium]
MNETDRRRSSGSALAIVVIVILVLIVILVFLPRRKPKLPEAHGQIVAVRTVTVAPARLDDTILLPGRIEAQFESTLALDKPGMVEELLVDKGDRVEAGQVLLRLDDRSWKANLERAQIEFREAEKNLKRWQELKTTGAVSPTDFDAVQTRYDVAKVSQDDATVNFSKCTLKSPAAGVIVDRYVQRGEYLAEGARVFRLVDADTVKLAVEVPERDVLGVAPRQRIAFVVDTIPGRAFTGEVTFVSNAARAETGAFPMELRSANPDGILRPGMIARVTLVRGVREGAIVLPLSAVVPKKGEYMVFVVENGKALRRVVKVDSLSDRDAVIASGVSAGDEVVVEGNRALVDGLPVEVRNDG